MLRTCQQENEAIISSLIILHQGYYLYVSSSTLLETREPLRLRIENTIAVAVANNYQTLTVIAFHPFRIVLDIERATSIELLVIANGNATNRLLNAYSLAHKFTKTSVYNNHR